MFRILLIFLIIAFFLWQIVKEINVDPKKEEKERELREAERELALLKMEIELKKLDNEIDKTREELDD